MKKLLKECFVTIWRTKKRFISIFVTVLLGVGFFAGIKATSPDMEKTVDKYYNETNFMDINLKSTWGITNDEVETLKTKGYNFNVGYEFDAIVKSNVDEKENVAKILSYNENNTINKIELLKGRLPKNNNECVIELNDYKEIYELNTKLTIDNENLIEKELTVVGFIRSPLYISIERGTTNLLTGSINYYLYVLESNIKSDYYTDIYLKLNTNNNSFSDDYKDLINKNIEELEHITDTFVDNRFNNEISKGNIEIKDAKDKLAKEKNNFNKKIKDTKTKIENGKKEYQNNVSKLNNTKESTLNTFNIKENELNEGLNNLKLLLKSYGDIENNETDNIKAQITTIENSLIELVNNKDVFLSEIKKAESDLENALNEIKKSENELKTEEDKYVKEFSKYESDIKEQENKLNALEKPKWYVLNREDNLGFFQFSADTKRIDNVAKLFPLVFYIVAIFICLTSMTRMVEEERTQIGTLKSLGFTDNEIVLKYIIYSLLSTILGSIIGLLIGFNILPNIIFKMYDLMYDLGNIVIAFNLKYALTGSLIAIFCILFSTMFVLYGVVRENPAKLLRPKPFKNGKRVWLERLPFIWKRFSFIDKVTARNTFRYKKRFLMTIIGVCGSTGLILAGFGLKDCITGMVPNQYEKLFQYQAEITLKNDVPLDELNKTYENITKLDKVDSSLKVFKEAIKLDNYKTNQSIYLIVPFDNIDNYILLNNRSTKEKYNLENKVIITEKITQLLNIKENDMLEISGTKDLKVKVNNITENYLNHFIYMEESIYNSEIFNTILLRTDNMNKEEEQVFANLIKENESVASISFTSSMRNVFDNTMDSFSSVTLVLIISAGLLAFVVLYNLASINISERKRELATLKVLGFYDKEVYSYLNRETFILSGIGMLLGLGLGKILTLFIMKTCELDMIMFNTTINYFSYVYAVIITLVFIFIVDKITYQTIKKVDMVESLKGVE